MGVASPQPAPRRARRGGRPPPPPRALSPRRARAHAPSPFRLPRWPAARPGTPHCAAWCGRWRIWTWCGRGGVKGWACVPVSPPRADANRGPKPRVVSDFSSSSHARPACRPLLPTLFFFRPAPASTSAAWHARFPLPQPHPVPPAARTSLPTQENHVRLWWRVVVRARPGRAPVRVDLDVRRLCARRLHPAPAAVHHRQAQGRGQGGRGGRVQAVGGEEEEGRWGGAGGRAKWGARCFFFSSRARGVQRALGARPGAGPPRGPALDPVARVPVAGWGTGPGRPGGGEGEDGAGRAGPAPSPRPPLPSPPLLLDGFSLARRRPHPWGAEAPPPPPHSPPHSPAPLLPFSLPARPRPAATAEARPSRRPACWPGPAGPRPCAWSSCGRAGPACWRSRARGRSSRRPSTRGTS